MEKDSRERIKIMAEKLSMTETEAKFVEAFHKVTDGAGPDFEYQEPTEDEYRALKGWGPDKEVPFGSCAYNRIDGRLGCVIGETLREMGIEVGPEHEGSQAWTVLEDLVPGMRPTFLTAADMAQSAQDTGKTWGEARSKFDRELVGYVDA